jgi:hypothetical protein
MKGTKFEAVSSIQQIVTRELKAIWEEAFSRSFYSLYKRCKFCVEAGFNMVLINVLHLFCVVFYGLRSGTYLSHCVNSGRTQQDTLPPTILLLLSWRFPSDSLDIVSARTCLLTVV